MIETRPDVMSLSLQSADETEAKHVKIFAGPYALSVTVVPVMLESRVDNSRVG